LRLSEPLPPIDAVGLIQAIEENYTDWVFAHESTDAEWWERSTAQTWLRYINIAREFGVPVSLEITQFFRATLLYDTIATRLNKDIDFNAEYKEYARGAGKKARRRVQKAVRDRLGGPTDNDYLTIEQVGDTITQFYFLWQRLVEDPAIQFKNIVGKIAYAVSMLMRIGYLAILVAGFAVVTALLALAMGVRNATVRRLGVPDLTTTVLTMTLTGLAADSRIAGGSGEGSLRRIAAVLAMLSGAVAGALLLKISLVPPLLAAAALALLLALVYVPIARRRG